MKYFSLCKKTTLQKYHIYIFIYLFIHIFLHTHMYSDFAFGNARKTVKFVIRITNKDYIFRQRMII